MIKQLVPTTEPFTFAEHVAWGAGFVIGLVLTFASWKGNAEGTGFKEDPRVKALLWGLAGLVVTLIGDWKSLLGEEGIAHFNRLGLLSQYIEGYLVAIVATIAIFCITIYFSTRHANKSLLPRQRVSPLKVVNDFLLKGYEYAQERYENAQERTHSTERAELRSTIALGRELNQKRLTALAAATVEVARHVRAPTVRPKEHLCRQILDHMCTVAEFFLRDGEDFLINSNYMLALPYSPDLENKHRMEFTYGDHGRYGHILLLKEYARPGSSAQPEFSLPVDDPAKNQNWLNMVLPGAPQAFLLGQALAVGANTEYPKDIPLDIQQQIRDYIERQNFNCFICLIIPVLHADNKPIGIVNIETNHDKILGAPDQTKAELIDVLNPFCALLGLLLSCEDQR